MIKFKKKDKLQPGATYAVQTGDYAGEMLVYVQTDILYHRFLSLPLMINRNIPKHSFEFGRNNHIIDFVEKLPSKIFQVVEAQFHKNENTYNRREQLDSQNVLDS